MAYKANGTELPIVAVNAGDVFTAEGVRREGLVMALESMPTTEQVRALLCGEIAQVDDDGETKSEFSGYTEALGCTVTLVRPDAGAAAIEEAQAAVEAAEARSIGLARMAAAVMTDEQAMGHTEAWPVWRAAQVYEAGEIVQHKGALYRIEQAHTSQAHQPPGSTGMLAIYRPVQVAADGEVLPWVSGEALEIGDKRSYGGVVYEVYTAVGANVHSPDLVASVWKVVG